MLERPAHGDALLIVDVQNDFLPGGALAVPGGDEVIGAINRAIRLFEASGLPVFATRDWHPADHCSFREQGGPWPPHCVQNSRGAELAARLELPRSAVLVSKATSPERDAYSGFDGTNLEERLRAAGARRLYVGGLATDYCVLATVRHAIERGFRVHLLVDAVRAVDARPGDGERAIEQMDRLGAVLTEVGGEDVQPPAPAP
ncbi:MAG: nicotinamidase [Deltaproteobacteria bacterium]|nr:nicotinamidase [Deltaproteobacteria bacterium]